MKNKISLLLLLLLVIGCKSYNKELFPRLNKEDSKVVIDFFKYVHKGKAFDIKNLKKIEEIQDMKYPIQEIIGFWKTRYISRDSTILYLNKSNSRNLYIKDIKTGISKVLLNQSDYIYSFDINSTGDKILLSCSGRIKVYSYPNVKLLYELQGGRAFFDVDIDRIYYRFNYNIFSYFQGHKKEIYKGGGGQKISKLDYRILKNKDIYIKLYRYNHGQKDRWYYPPYLSLLMYGKGWWEHFLLSNYKREIPPPPLYLQQMKSIKIIFNNKCY